MKNSALRWCLLGIFTILLSGCDQQKTQDNVVSINALPLIQNTILQLAPTFSGVRNTPIMEQICAVAKGEISDEQFHKFFLEREIDIKAAAKEDVGFALLADSSMSEKRRACAAYIATSVFFMPDLTLFQTDDLSAVSDILMQRVSIMNANAEVFSLIAQRLQGFDDMSLVDYKLLISELFSELSTVYMQRLHANLLQDATYRIIDKDRNHFSFITSYGYEYSLKDGLPTLKLADINWYGNGELLGKNHFIDVVIYKSE